ncbi:MAG: hypothetical protein IJU52_07235 [Clostridia bacterium]|nr:hypothetical protein [Clostridia bacterium]
MTKPENEQSVKKRINAIDLFLIIGVLLVLVAIIGQDVAVYMINRQDKSDRFEVFFSIRSVEEANVDQLADLRLSSSQVIVSVDGRELGKVNGGLERGSAENAHLYSVTGSMYVYGRNADGLCYPFAYGRALREGDRVYAVFEDRDGAVTAHGYTLEITEIKLLENS